VKSIYHIGKNTHYAGPMITLKISCESFFMNIHSIRREKSSSHEQGCSDGMQQGHGGASRLQMVMIRFVLGMNTRLRNNINHVGIVSVAASCTLEGKGNAKYWRVC
jgi:hypothetical protein